jgi:addiction module HigA family antidote
MTQMLRFDTLAPPSPGQVLKEKLLDGTKLSQAELARAIGLSRPRLNMILSGRCQITAAVALRIEKVFGFSPQYWLRLRYEFELFEERQRISHELESLPRLSSNPITTADSAWQISTWQAAA